MSAQLLSAGGGELYAWLSLGAGHLAEGTVSRAPLLAYAVDCALSGAAASCALAAPERTMLRVEPGRFSMGSPLDEPGRGESELPHEVEISQAFLLDAYELTQGQWTLLMGENPSTFAGCERCPVERVSWFDALAFCNALSRLHGLQPCYDLEFCVGRPGSGGYECPDSVEQHPSCTGYRLPTEAEWEYAARAGSTSALPSGELLELGCGSDPGLSEIAWYCGNAGETTHEVGQLEPNPWGFYDLSGNVWEWTGDLLAPYSTEPQRDPQRKSGRGERVGRGGAWDSEARETRAAYRDSGAPAERSADLGFRVARSLAP